MGRGVLALLWQLSSVQCRHLYSSAPTATIDANFYENYAPFRPKTSYEPDHSVPTYLCHTETAHRAIDQRLREKNFNFVLDIPNFPKNNPFIIISRYPDSSRYSWIRLQTWRGGTLIVKKGNSRVGGEEERAWPFLAFVESPMIHRGLYAPPALLSTLTPLPS